MNETPFCSIALSSDLPLDEVESLSTMIQLTAAKVQRTPSRVFGADDLATVITILVGIGQLAEYGTKLAIAINKWRRNARAKRLEPKGRLERPEHPPLDLETATDDEVKEWLSR